MFCGTCIGIIARHKCSEDRSQVLISMTLFILTVVEPTFFFLLADCFATLLALDGSIFIATHLVSPFDWLQPYISTRPRFLFIRCVYFFERMHSPSALCGTTC